MQNFHFEAVARLQRFLGKELIADPNLAIIEFVKNSYDAGATEVYIDFTIASLLKENQTITISDNGTGMDRVSFEENWMRPGYSYKAKLGEPPSDASEKSTSADVLKRVPVGEKGLGRLAAGRLADQIHIYTRRSEDSPWFHVYIDWDQFKSMDTLLKDIPIPYDEAEQPENPRFKTGTIIVLKQLTIDWEGQIPGRKRLGRSSYRLVRLREDISILMQPLPKTQIEFQIHLNSNSDFTYLKDFNGPVSTTEPGLLDYQFELNVSEVEELIYIKRIVTRGEDVKKVTEKPMVTEEEGSLNQLYTTDQLKQLPKSLDCGPFSATLFYSPESSRAFKALNIQPGVFVYRDGIRVEPYGQEGNDWLGAMAWKASRQGYAPVQPKYLNGFFTISRTSNTELRDMSNREGLIDNDEYRTFLTISRNEFRWFADLVFNEYVQPQWETVQEKVRKSSQQRQVFGIAVIRAIAHGVRQSIAGLGAEVHNIHQIAERSSIPKEVRDELLTLEERSRKHLRRMDETIDRFLQFDQDRLTAIEVFEEIYLQDVLVKAVSQTQSLADSKKVVPQLETGAQYKFFFNKEALVSAVSELVSNGIEAAASTKHEAGWVRISAKRLEGGGCEILVEDNGPGLESSNIDELLANSESRKGRPGIGLRLTRENLALSGGELSIQTTSAQGSVFKITLPATKELR